MDKKNKVPAYIIFDDANGKLQVFAEYDKKYGYILAMEIEYTRHIEMVEHLLLSANEKLDIKDLADIFKSEKFLLTFEH